MPDVYNVNEKMHKMRAKLYPNYLPGSEGTYIARTANEGAVSIADICAAMRNRAGYAGSHDAAIQTVTHFFKELEYQLADGFSVNTGFFTIHPHIGGVFHSDKDAHDQKKHPVTFRFQSLKPLRNLRNQIEVILEGYADTAGWISEFFDTDEDSSNTLYVPGDIFIITGHKIKVDGDNPDVGIYFVPVDDPSKAVKVKRIAENTPAKIIGVAPDVGHQQIRIEIRTQFTGSGDRQLKTPRIIVSSFVLEEA